jgi:hypothetical protein
VIEWPAVDPRTGAFLWSARKDLFWIAGGGSLLFALAAVPVTLMLPHAADLLVVAFLHLGAFCNYPHYAVTYQLIVRERARAPASYFWLVVSMPIAIAAVIVGVVYGSAIGVIVRIYLSWSVYHYAAQHFGIAAMYQGRAKSPLADREKRALQLGFIAVCLHLLLLLNMKNGIGSDDAFGVAGGALLVGPLLPASLYPIVLIPVAIGIALHALAERWHKERTGKALVPMARVLVATNFVWFAVPYLRLPGSDHPWTGSTIATWVPFALPFFHCAQYLGVTGWRARTTGAIKPVLYYALLVAIGLVLFEGIARGLAFTSLGEERAFLLVPAVLNIHHFFLDGLMWKRSRAPKPAAPPVQQRSSGRTQRHSLPK